MAASAWLVHNKAKEYVGNKVIDFDADQFSMILCLSGSNVHSATTDAYSTVTSEVAQNFGYLTGGKVVTANTWAESGGSVTFDHDDVVWTAGGGDITAHYAAVKDDDVASPVIDPIICSSQLDTSPADVTATDGNTFTVQINVSGVFVLS